MDQLAQIRQRVEAEWYNGNISEEVCDRILDPSPNFTCSVCDYTSDEYGDTHTHPRTLPDIVKEFHQ